MSSSWKGKQKSLTSFFGGAKTIPAARKRPSLAVKRGGSYFGECPLCSKSYPLHQLERHASSCNGNIVALSEQFPSSSGRTSKGALQPTSEPIPGLYLYEDFVSEEQERAILSELDGTSRESEFLEWKPSNFNGKHLGKRWGVHCNLRDRRVDAAETALPHFFKTLIMPKLKHLETMQKCTPNEANAIDYRKGVHFLASHVDDRKLSKEPIANLSLAGDCVMTFRNVSPHRNVAEPVVRVLLKKRCLQVLTGKSRYDFSHGISIQDILSDRRVSVTMRESPLTVRASSQQKQWWHAQSPVELSRPLKRETIESSFEPLPGLFLFPDFISPEEENHIIEQLDNDASPWSVERHTGVNRQKRWGIDHDLWSQAVRSPKHPLPSFVTDLLIPRLRLVLAMKGCVPNDVNAVEYRRSMGHSLGQHVDDRKKHKEPIANLSLCGDCYFTYQNCHPHRNLAEKEKRVLLQRRCLQVMTGNARYNFSHGIKSEDVLSERRVSLTMRETPFP